MEVAAQLAVMEHEPVPLVIVTVAVAGLVPVTELTVHTLPVPSVRTGGKPALEVAVTVNVVL